MLASIFSILASPPWWIFWEKVEFVSIVVIGLGCAGEAFAEHHKFKEGLSAMFIPSKSPQQILKRVCGWMVVVGLGVELIAFGFSFVASNREIEGLRQKNNEIEARLAPRSISTKQ